MIVKNEEKRLPTALKSAKPWVDEIIVVDTGSTDRTVEIAESFGAKIYHHPWEHSFSKARNQSLSYATGDWMLILDADEELDQETAPMMRQLVNAPKKICGFLFELYNDVTAGGETFILHPRLFRNHVGFRYEGKVHNRPTVPGSMARSKVKLIHYGYNETPEVMEAKHQRRLTMIRKWVEEEPDNYQAHSYLAHTLLSRRETMPEAVEVARTALKLLDSRRGDAKDYPHTYYPLLNGLTLLDRDDELLEAAPACLEKVPYYPDPLFFMVWVHYRKQNWQEVCELADKFLAVQDECKEHPERFVFFENMTYDQINYALFRWVVAAARLGKDDKATFAFERMLKERDAEKAVQSLLQNLLGSGHLPLAVKLLPLAEEAHPDWTWVTELKTACNQKMKEESSEAIKTRGISVLKQGQPRQAAEILKQALDIFPRDAEALLNLGKALWEEGSSTEAEYWLIKGLNAHPGHGWAWRMLGDILFKKGDPSQASYCYERYLGQIPKDDDTKARYESCRKAPDPHGPKVAEKPPKLVVFLVSGMSPEMVRQPAPHFLMGKAWGELLDPQGQGMDLPAWATILTGSREHGLVREPTRSEIISFKDLNTPTLWELMPPDLKIGLVATPFGHPPAELPGFGISGYPAGLLESSMVNPVELTPRVLAKGYRADFALSDFDDQTTAQKLETDIRHEAFLYQLERNKLAAALDMPCVDVLVVGFTALDHMQKAHDLAHYKAFTAYQQVYAWIEGVLQGLNPEYYAILGQRSYARQDKIPQPNGFYCLSWMKGENGKAHATDVAPAILSLMGGNPARLGRPRG
jgi:tetratricopeptide (TPR) repeat protein